MIEAIERRVGRSVAPPPAMRISEWANTYRILSSESSAESGRFSIERTPYMRDIYDALLDPSVTEVWFMKSAQVGYSEFLNNVIGAHVHLNPCPIMMLQPTIDMANAYSKDRISPMFRDTPVLRDLVNEKSRDRGATILHKLFPGGHLTLAGANSPASLASRPIKGILIDEPDRYPESAGDEGDPINILRKRSTTFWDRFFFAGGTPTVAGRSRIESGYNRGDRRLYFVPCPACGEMIDLRFKQFELDDNAKRFAQYQCQECKDWISHEHKIAMISDVEMGGAAEWRATREGPHSIRSYRIWEAYSPWVTWEDLCLSYLEARELGHEGKKVFFNTSLGETYVEAGEVPDEDKLLGRREDYDPSCIPKGVRVITAGVDTQDECFHVEIVGWGRGEENWSLEFRTIWGDPENEEVQRDLDAFLRESRYTRAEDEKQFPISAALVDSGGHRRDAVYRFCRGKNLRRIYPCKGSSIRDKPILASLTPQKKERVKLALVGTDTAKESLYAQLDREGSGPGRCHWPLSYDRDYFRQLTAEEKVTEHKSGRAVQKWVVRKDECPNTGKVITRENHVLDCRVYAKAALRLLPLSLYAMPSRKPTGVKTDKKPEIPAKKSRRTARKPAKTWGKTW